MEGCSYYLLKSSRKTLLELLFDRGYYPKVQKEQLINDVSLDIVATNKMEKSIRVVYILEKRQVPSIKEYIAKHCMDSENTTHIVVTQFNINKTFRTLCNTYNIEMFNINSLGVNITKHILVPKHTLITDSETKENVKTKLCLKKWSELPLIRISDPIASYYGAKNGDVFEITRNSKTAGEYISYRYCVPTG